MYLEINLLSVFNLKLIIWYNLLIIYLHPQHPDQKQRMRVKNPPRWGVCGAGFADAGADCIVVSWVVVGIAGAAVAAVASAAASSFSAAISNSICSDIRSLSTASVWSLLNSITASMRFLITPVVRSV